MSAAMMDDADAPTGGSDGRTRSVALIGRPLDLAGRAVLLATDGSPCSMAAARVAHELAAQHHAVVHVVSVVDSRPVPIPPPLNAALAFSDEIAGPELHREQARAVCTELSDALGEPIAWPVRVMLGTPSAAIVQEAHHIGAVLIVVGLRRHGRLDRVRHDETALNVMRTAGCPVLGIVAEQDGLPRRVLAAVDFGEGSLTALRAAWAVAGAKPTFICAYVHPMYGFLADQGEAKIHDLGVETGFEKLARDVSEEGLTFDHVVLHHAPPQSVGQTLLEYADETGCDLITAGSVHHSRLDRWMVGSVSTELVRDGRRSVLIAPPQRQA
jgi:nucleotide-binding universal stress UspA family protein